MKQHNTHNGTFRCPDCGNQLAQKGDLLCCPEHGTFFIYGGQLLVRTPRTDVRLSDTVLPWEDQAPGKEMGR